MDGHPKGHGIRPHSLKVAEISALTTAVIKGNANSSQLETRCHYLAVKPHDMAKISTMYVAQQHLFVANFAQSAFLGNKAPGDLAMGRRSF